MAANKNRKVAPKLADDGTFTIRLLALFAKGPARYFVVCGIIVLIGYAIWNSQRPNETVTATGPGSVAVMKNSGTISTGDARRSIAPASEPAKSEMADK